MARRRRPDRFGLADRRREEPPQRRHVVDCQRYVGDKLQPRRNGMADHGAGIDEAGPHAAGPAGRTVGGGNERIVEELADALKEKLAETREFFSLLKNR